MFNKSFRFFSAVLVICLLLTVVPINALADGCKWYGQDTWYSYSASKGTKKIYVNCDSSYSVKYELLENTDYPLEGYKNNWATVRRLNNKYLSITMQENFCDEDRYCVITLTCNRHRSTRTIIVTQKATTRPKPQILSATFYPSSVKPGQRVTLKLKTRYCGRLFADLREYGLSTTNLIRSSNYKGQGTLNYSFYVSKNAEPGEHYIKIEASNSNTQDDGWAQRVTDWAIIKIN